MTSFKSNDSKRHSNHPVSGPFTLLPYSASEIALRPIVRAFAMVAAACCFALAGCGASGGGAPAPTTYVLTVDSTGPSSGVAIGVAPADVSGSSAGTTSFTRTYDSGATVTLTAPATTGSGATETAFSKWTGCTTASGTTCSLSLSANSTVTASYAPATYTLTVASKGATGPVSVMASPADANGLTSGSTGFTLTYPAGTAVTLTVPQITVSGNNSASFVSTAGCTSVSGENCYVTMDANTTVTATYAANLVTILPYPATATIGSTLQFSAIVNDPSTTNQAVTWSVTEPSGGTASAGDFSGNGLYTTPYPAPSMVFVTATSVGDPGASLTIPVTLTVPPAAAGPALTVDLGKPTHPISPYIYGMNNFFTLSPSQLQGAGITIDRWGGDGSQRYNYKIDAVNSAADWYFENHAGSTGVEETGVVNQTLEADQPAGVKTLVTVNALGWISSSTSGCGFPTSIYPQQFAVDPYSLACGDGELPNQTNITGNDPTWTSMAVGPSFTNGWVQYLTNKFGNSASGGVLAYELDNEPAWWDGVHKDVHPEPSSYDELAPNEIAVAEAVKTADPTVAVSGPVIDNWWNYFYSKKDINAGWGVGPCYTWWSNPIDRKAHGGIPNIEYYLQQFQAASNAFGARLLDYLDLHAYYSGDYQGNQTAFTTAGDTGEQQVRLNSTRAFWDPTYTDPNEPQPNYPTDPNYYTTNCNLPLQPPQIIPMMKQWIANDYPGTKTAITEYNWGGQESINGAIAQADLLGIFGREGLDMATLWGPPDPVKQVPGLVAYQVYGNYDGAGSKFGDMALASTSTNQGQLAIYGSQRTSDGAVTIIVLNKTYGSLTDTISLPNLTATGSAKVYLYSADYLASLVAQSPVPITAPASGSTTSSLSMNFPAQSITLLVIPTK